MFVTCFYGVLDPGSGALRYANAGHSLPLVRTGDQASELRATVMPLGLMPGMGYEVKHTTIAAGARVLLYSDGLIEAHDSSREMFGTARAAAVLAGAASAGGTLDALLGALDGFTGSVDEQEDDITLVALTRDPLPASPGDRVLADFTVPSAPGNERDAILRVEQALRGVGLSAARLERLGTAVGAGGQGADLRSRPRRAVRRRRAAGYRRQARGAPVAPRLGSAADRGDGRLGPPHHRGRTPRRRARDRSRRSDGWHRPALRRRSARLPRGR
jgi:hypothetical protein